MNLPCHEFLDGDLDQVCANLLRKHEGAMRQSLLRILESVSVPPRFMEVFEDLSLDAAMTAVVNHCIDALAAHFKITVPEDQKPTIALFEGMPSPFAAAAGHRSMYDSHGNVMQLAASDILNGNAYFDVASRFIRALSAEEVGQELRGQEATSVYSFFGGLGQKVGRELVRGTEYEFLFEVVFKPDTVLNAVGPLTTMPLQDYLKYRLSQYEFAELSIVLYGLAEISKLAMSGDALANACFDTLPLLIAQAATDVEDHVGFKFMHNLVSMHQTEVLLAVARRFMAEHGEYLAVARSARQFPRYYVGLLRCGAFTTGAQLVTDFLVEHAPNLAESARNWCRQESKRCVEVRDHSMGFTVYNHMLSGAQMSYTPVRFRCNCLRAAMTDKEAGKRLALYNYNSRCEVPTCVLEDVMKDLDRLSNKELVSEVEQIEREIKSLEAQSPMARDTSALTSREGC